MRPGSLRQQLISTRIRSTWRLTCQRVCIIGSTSLSQFGSVQFVGCERGFRDLLDKVSQGASDNKAWMRSPLVADSFAFHTSAILASSADTEPEESNCHIFSSRQNQFADRSSFSSVGSLLHVQRQRKPCRRRRSTQCRSRAGTSATDVSKSEMYAGVYPILFYNFITRLLYKNSYWLNNMYWLANCNLFIVQTISFMLFTSNVISSAVCQMQWRHLGGHGGSADPQGLWSVKVLHYL